MGRAKLKRALGTHLLVEMLGCDAQLLKRTDYVERVMVEAARKGRMSILTYNFHQFAPYGVSGVVIIEESHMSIHTWPEYRYAAVDIFYCSDEDQVDTAKAMEVLKEGFKATKCIIKTLHRGELGTLEEWIVPEMAEAAESA